MLALYLLYILLSACAQAQITPTETYVHSATLRSGTIRIYWKFNETHIVFEVHGQTTGWIGIGFSPNGAMTGADIYIGWVKSGSTTVTDRHGVGNTFPPLDPEENIDVLAGMESGGWTMFKFSRQLARCEETYDREITADTQRLIYAWGTEDPIGSDVTFANYHGTTNRGTESIYFLQSAETPNGLPPGPNYTTIDILSENFTIPPEGTYYNCRLFRLPTLGKKHHIVKMEAIIEEGNELNVHHILVYRCGDILQNEHELGANARCYTRNMQHFETCSTVIGAWAIGGSAFYYPDNAGFSIGADGDPVYIQLEIHYDNPSLTAGKMDSSGMRFTYTDTLRELDVGVLEQGLETSALNFMIPPGAERFQTTGHCTPFCIDSALDGASVDNITIFAIVLHSHLAGRSLRLRHIRNGVELPYLASDATYDFNYQETRYLHPPAVLKKGDSLRMECVYNTQGRTNVTVGGLATNDEMCLSFIFYYPKIDLAHCISAASFQYTWPQMGINLTQLTHITATPFLMQNILYQNQTVFDFFNQISWTEEAIDHFQAINNILQYEVCVPQNKSLTKVNFSLFVTEIPNPFVSTPRHCSNVQETTTVVAETKSNSVTSRSTHLDSTINDVWSRTTHVSSTTDSVTVGILDSTSHGDLDRATHVSSTSDSETVANLNTTSDGAATSTLLTTTSKSVTIASLSVNTLLIVAVFINMML